MLQENVPYSFYLCDWHLTIEWKRSGNKTYQVDVMIHDPQLPLHGGDLSIALLDPENNPLPLLNPAIDFSPLLSIVWAAQETQYKIARFGRGQSEPALIQFDLRGHRASIPLASGGKGKSKAKLRDDRDGDKKKDDREDKKDGRRRDDGARRAPPPPQCCVTQFNTPNGALPTTTVAAVGGSTFQCQPWVITSTFDDTAPCKCTCCEYRQLVKGTATTTAPGGAAPVDVTPVTDYAPPPAGPVAPGAPPPAPVPIKGVNATTWVEDSTGVPTRPGNPSRYGPRAQAKDGTQDYPTVCTYWGLDSPQAGIPTGTRFTINMNFRGLIRDVCRNVDSKGPNEWNWVTNQVG
jgi:hypothetical protein